jgi:NAD(P)-dependent dehydrogenase (short-subunit alcohol dehydrogenase family)
MPESTRQPSGRSTIVAAGEEAFMALPAFDLSGKVSLVTGGNSGIGLGMAEGLAAAGADVAIWGRSEEKLAAAHERLCSYGGRVLARAIDVSDPQAVTKAMRECVTELGRLDAVFANAGIGRGGPFLDLQEADYRAVLGTNLDGVVWTLREAARHMVQRAEAGDRGGSLIAVSSLAAIEGAARNETYAASKGAITALVRALAVEFARYGIRANSVLPGWITTPLSEAGQNNPAFVSKVLPRIPARRWGSPDDFAGIAVYLASDASAYHSGDSLVIDGGYAVF